MRVKNVSSTDIDIEEFNLHLKPGDIGDLSPFDPKDIHSHKRLNACFEKCLLVNLGNLVPPGTKAALQSARNRIAKLKLGGDYVAKSKNQSSARAKIEELTKKRNDRSKKTEPLETERYSDEYYYNMNPERQERESFGPKPRPKIQEEFKSMEVAPDGSVVFGSYGQIETEVLTGKTNFIVPSSQENKEEKHIVKDAAGNEYQVSLENIKNKIQRKCIGFSSSGKPCGKFSVHGFSSCLTHMSKTELKEYEELKRSQSRGANGAKI